MVWLVFPENLITKIFVICNQNPVFRMRFFDDDFVI